MESRRPGWTTPTRQLSVQLSRPSWTASTSPRDEALPSVVVGLGDDPGGSGYGPRHGGSTLDHGRHVMLCVRRLSGQLWRTQRADERGGIDNGCDGLHLRWRGYGP